MSLLKRVDNNILKNNALYQYVNIQLLSNSNQLYIR